MYKQLGLVDLVKAIKNRVEANTNLKCYDSIPTNAESPFFFAEVVSKRPSHTKTMYRDVFTVWIHAIAEKNKSSVSIYELVKLLEEAMTDDIELPDKYELIMQNSSGIQTITTDETDEKHAVVAYEFTACYGLKMKV